MKMSEKRKRLSGGELERIVMELDIKLCRESNHLLFVSYFMHIRGTLVWQVKTERTGGPDPYSSQLAGL